MHDPRAPHPSSSSWRPLALVLVAALLLPAGVAAARERPGPSDDDAVTDEERDEAIARALRWLVPTAQRLPDVQGTPRGPFTKAATGYVLLLARETRGLPTESDALRRLRDEILDHLQEVERRSRDETQLPAQHGLASSEALCQYTWPIAMGALFLEEAHHQGLWRGRTKDALERSVRVLEEAQQEGGGWGHGRIRPADAPAAPRPSPLEEAIPEALRERLRGGGAFAGYPSTLLASSILVAGAVGQAGRTLDPDDLPALAPMTAYFHGAQLENGNFPYDPSQRSAHLDRTGAGRAAGAIWALDRLGVDPRHRTRKRAADYVDAHVEDLSEGHGSATLVLLYGALGQHARGEAAWRDFRRTFFRRLVDAQAEDGRMQCICEGRLAAATNDSTGPGAGFLRDTTDAYVTALHTWILLLDHRPSAGDGARPRPPRGPVTPR